MIHRSFIIFIGSVILLSVFFSCRSKKNKVVAYTSVDQVFSDPVFRQCQKSAGLTVKTLFDTEETKSTGVLNRLIAEAKTPQADVFWSGDPVRPFVLIDRGLTLAYQSPNAANIPTVFRGSGGMWSGLAARARVLLVNTDLVTEALDPKSIRDLADPAWKGKTAIANPLFGTTTMHVAALFSVWGTEPAKAFLQQLKSNDVRIASSNGEVKRLVVSGEVAFGLTDTDDAFEAVADGAPVRIVYPDQAEMGTLVMPTVAVLLKGGPHPEKGKKLIDCLLSGEAEEYLAEHGAHMPLRPGTPVPANMRSVDSIKAMQVDYAKVAKTMEEIQPWLREWVGL